MAHKLKVTKKTWFIATNGEVTHHGVSEKNTQIDTGLTDLFTFTNEDDYLSKLADLNIKIEE